MTSRLRELLGVAVITSIIVGALVLKGYVGASLWPGLVTGFTGSLLAFMLALKWERERDRLRGAAETQALEERRKTEARRRFEPIRAELRTNAKSLEELRVSTSRCPERSKSSTRSCSREPGWPAHRVSIE